MSARILPTFSPENLQTIPHILFSSVIHATICLCAFFITAVEKKKKTLFHQIVRMFQSIQLNFHRLLQSLNIKCTYLQPQRHVLVVLNHKKSKVFEMIICWQKKSKNGNIYKHLFSTELITILRLPCRCHFRSGTAGRPGQDQSPPQSTRVFTGAFQEVGLGRNDLADAPEGSRLGRTLHGLAGNPKPRVATIPVCPWQPDQRTDVLLLEGPGEESSWVFRVEV